MRSTHPRTGATKPSRPQVVDEGKPQGQGDAVDEGQDWVPVRQTRCLPPEEGERSGLGEELVRQGRREQSDNVDDGVREDERTDHDELAPADVAVGGRGRDAFRDVVEEPGDDGESPEDECQELREYGSDDGSNECQSTEGEETRDAEEEEQTDDDLRYLYQRVERSPHTT
ncbi:hypothetical protein [Haloarchaeobius sp. TZWWS8]|uniref:hypothetical protein n=1 Tax=Haloarchaeobius sp. TZWWS8 TaxID=3446121 RepID=UPI003EBA57D2